MCTRPLLLPVPLKVSPSEHRYLRYFCDHDHNYCYREVTDRGPHFVYRMVPCGCCAECLKKKHNELAIRLYRQCCRSYSVDFLTLTYNNESVPVAFTHEIVDTVTGELVLSDVKLYDSAVLRGFLFSKSDNHVLPDLFVGSHNGLRSYFAPSLRRSDVSDCLKRSRERYARLHGHRSEFTYYLVGEYGSRTKRPHYHLLLWDCPRDFIDILCQEWNALYGFALNKHVNPQVKDGVSSGYLATCRYISKYVSKGQFDSDRPAYKFTQKGRVCSSRYIGLSKHFDLSDDKQVHDWLLGFDLSPVASGVDWSSTNPILSVSQSRFFEFIRDRIRNFIVLSGEHYSPLPQQYLKRLFYKYNNQTKKYEKLPLFALYKDWLARVVYQELREKLPSYFSEYNEVANLAVLRYSRIESLALQDRDRRAFQSLKKSFSECRL